MFCVKCGKELEDGAKFCAYCGNPVASAGETPKSSVKPVVSEPSEKPIQPSVNEAPKPSAEKNGSEPAPKSNKKLFAILGVVVGLLLIVAVVLAAVYVSKNHNLKEEDVLSEDTENVVQTEDVTTEEEAASEEEPVAEEEENLLSADTKEGKLQREILKMNDSSYKEQMIDVYEIKREPGQRDTSYIWNDTVFYTLEGYRSDDDYENKNQCTLVKKELINKDTGNVMDYEIYSNPSDHVANKIVSIEYLQDGIEVTEYYYNKDKEPNFVFQYQTDNYVSTYATPDKQGQRFLFNKDCLVTWRKVDENTTKNIVIGNDEYDRLTVSWAKDTLSQYADLDSDTKAKFDELEKRMLNAAYNTYETVMNAEGISMIQGYVYDEAGAGLSDAKVELYDENFDNVLYSTVTGTDGAYRVYVPFEEYAYNVCVLKDGFDSCDIYCVEVNNEQIGVYQDSIYLFQSGGSDTNVRMTLGDAFNYNSSGSGMIRLSAATVNVRKGINNRRGSEIVFSGTTDENGYIQVVLKPGVYTLEVISSGYETMYYTIIANPILDNVYEFYASPKLNEGEYAIVLTWGDTPHDLDSHLFTTKGTNSSHIWYGGMVDDFGNSLDVDDTDSYGPETIKINSLSSTDYYKYCVVDFTDCCQDNLSSYDMSNSQATVNVYSSDGWFQTFHVPTHTPGVIWEVFEIRNGKLTPIQRYYDNVTDKEWWHADK